MVHREKLLNNLWTNLRSAYFCLIKDHLLRQPLHDHIVLRRAPKCLEPNIQIRREFRPQDFEEISGAGATLPQQMRELADDVCSAFGLQQEVLLDG